MSRNGHRRLSDGEKLKRRLARYSEAIRLVDEGKARPQVVEAVELLRQGLNGSEIAKRLGIARSTAFQRLGDPTDEKNHNRKLAHYGTCKGCGAPTAYDVGKPSDHCRECAPDAYSFWSREVIIEAIREYHDRYGRPPVAMDWNLTMARSKANPARLVEIEDRWEEGCWPVVSQVQYRFGSWNAAIEAAGLSSIRAGAHLHDFTDSELLEAVREAGTFSSVEYEERRNGGPAVTTICRRFGRWQKALEAAGLRKVAA